MKLVHSIRINVDVEFDITNYSIDGRDIDWDEVEIDNIKLTSTPDVDAIREEILDQADLAIADAIYKDEDDRARELEAERGMDGEVVSFIAGR